MFVQMSKNSVLRNDMNTKVTPADLNGQESITSDFVLLSSNHLPFMSLQQLLCQLRWLSGLRRSYVHSLMIARRSLCPEKLGSNPGQGSKGINFSGWHGLDMSIIVTKRR